MTAGRPRSARRRPSPSDSLPRPASAREWATQFGHAAVIGVRERGLFDDVEKYCFFIGYPRSGHSLVGSLLNAHPEILIAHELDALGFVEHHFSRLQLYALLLERDEVFASLGRKWTGYDYVVPDQFQGRWTKLRVIGDKRGRGSTPLLGSQPKLLGRLRRLVGVPIRAVHITRNPYDNIATMARYLAAGAKRVSVKAAPEATPWVGKAIDNYAQLCTWMAAARPQFTPGELYEIPYETFVAEPASSLTEICHFVGVDPEPSFIEACAGIVWPGVRRSRDSVGWTEDDRRRVDGLIAAHLFLGSYSWDS